MTFLTSLPAPSGNGRVLRMMQPPPPSTSTTNSTTSSNASKTNITNSTSLAATAISRNIKRGAFVVFEGADRAGKSTQVATLVKHLVSLSIAAVAMRFPDRTTPIGRMIDAYLKNDDGGELEDHAIHLLFSANRWEAASALTKQLAQGTTVICDRYAYSGVAFSSAKVGEKQDEKQQQQEPLLSLPWCRQPDVGLPAPDAVIYLDLSQEEAERRGGYGEERYEKRDLQQRVRKRFHELRTMDQQARAQALADRAGSEPQSQERDTDAPLPPPWYVVDASKSPEQVQESIQSVVGEILQRVMGEEAMVSNEENDKEETFSSPPLGKLWEEGEFPLPEVLLAEEEA